VASVQLAFMCRLASQYVPSLTLDSSVLVSSVATNCFEKRITDFSACTKSLHFPFY